MTKRERLDCVAVRRRAQLALAKALAGKSPDEQVRILRRLTAQAPLWKTRRMRAPSGTQGPQAPAENDNRRDETQQSQATEVGLNCVSGKPGVIH